MGSSNAAGVAVVSTGGTIASLRAEGGKGVIAQLSLEELLRSVADDTSPPVAAVVDLTRINSWNVDPPLMWEVANTVERLVARDDVAGVVVTHGTDTLEETAFLVDVLVDTEKPVVFTAAMRAADETSPDGPDNLRSALKAAASPVLRDLGVLACLDGQLHAARSVRKWHTSSPDAFSSESSAVATLDAEGVFRRLSGSLPSWTVPGGVGGELPRPDDVPVLQAYSGMSGRVAHALAAATSPRGLVIEGFGMGHVPEALREAIGHLVDAGVLVVVATRVPRGGTWEVYGGSGGGTDLAQLGVLGAGELSAGKARLLLLACLADRDQADARELFQDGVTVLGRGGEAQTCDHKP